jgi:FkbM family methyltransferase
MPEVRITAPLHSHFAATAGLLDRGLRIATAIDIGCADGDFLLMLKAVRGVGDAAFLNIDANPIYEESLREMEAVIGARYHIGPLAAASGPVTMIQGEHSYWASLRTPEEGYWHDSGLTAKGAEHVTATTLDDLVRQRGLNGPFLLKLDVQGGERTVLQGARDVLAKTALVVIEVHREDCHPVHTLLDGAGFDLFDITDIGRNNAGNFAWYYGLYLERSLVSHFVAPLWTPDAAEANVAHQTRYRAAKRERNRQLLDLLRGQR